MATLTFLPQHIVAESRPGESLFHVAVRVGVDIETACVGKGTCGLCRIKIIEGEGYLSPVGQLDEKHLGNVYWLTRTRLACQAIIVDGDGDVVVELPPKKTRKAPRPNSGQQNVDSV